MPEQIALSQLELLEIPSPCIRVCETNNRGYCLGCLRSREERFNWLKFTPQEKRLVIELCKRRRNYIKAKKQDAQEQQNLDFNTPPKTDDLFPAD